MGIVNGRHLSDSTEKQKDTSQGLKAEQVIMTSVVAQQNKIICKKLYCNKFSVVDCWPHSQASQHVILVY